MVGTLLPYFLFAMLMLGFVAIDRYRRRSRFHEPPRNYSSHGSLDWTPSVGFWSGDTGSSWSGSNDGGCSFGGSDGGGSFGGDCGGSCDGGGGGGGGGGY